MLTGHKVLMGLTACVVMGTGCAGKDEAPGKVSFSKDIKPILKANCVVCHKPGAEGYKASGLSLESYASLMKGTKSGTVIEPGSSASSVLVRAVNRGANPPIVMPHRNPPLPKADVKILSAWVDQGALDN